jgi:hypothetical protein
MEHMSAELLTVDIGSLDPNPYRLLTKYPFIEPKIETLIRSVKDVGVWERIIVRRNGNRFQKAFGHHLEEACRRAGIKKIPVIVRELSDEQMVQFMGRENLEDYNANFLVMLETWEAATKFRGPGHEKNQGLEIARLLGWITIGQDGYERSNNTARACHGALILIQANHLSQKDLTDLPVKSVRDIVERTISKFEYLDRVAEKTKRPERSTELDKKYLGLAARSVARDAREGKIPTKNLGSEVEMRGVERAIRKNRETPLLADFAKSVSDQLHKILAEDSMATKLAEIEKVVPSITRDDDKHGLKRIDFALGSVGEKADRWRERLTPRGKKVIPFKLLKKQEKSA